MIDTILARRSIRKYADQPVTPEAVETLLRAAMAAPSAGNQQPWVFVVMNDRALLDRVPDFHPHALMVRQAPVAILVCADHRDLAHEAMWVQDCAAATENILLAAQSLGLGAVWLGIYPRDERVDGLRALCGLPDYLTPFALVPVGHPGETKDPADRYDPRRVRYNAWDDPADGEA